MVSAQEAGVGGLLLLFVITQVVSIGFVAWAIPGTIASFSGPDAVVAGIVLFLQVARGVAYIVGLVLIYRRDPRTPRYYLIVLAGVTLIMLLEAFGKTAQENVRSIGYAAFWFFYWRSSERVRLTFEPASGMTEIPKTP